MTHEMSVRRRFLALSTLVTMFAGAAACTAPARDEKAAAPAPAAPVDPTVAPTVEQLEAAVPENPLKEAYFGETHVHTSYSLDAYIGGARLTPDEAYKFAQGKDVTILGQTHNIQEAAGLDRGLRPRGVHRRDVLHAGAGRDGRRQSDARGAARPDERRRAEGVVPQVCGREQPRRQPSPSAVLRRAGDDQERLEGRPHPGRDRQLSARQVHDAGGLRVDRRAQGRQHAPQRHLPGLERPGYAVLRARQRRRREALGLDGRAGEEGFEAAGHSAQLQRQQGLHVRVPRQRRPTPDCRVRKAAQPLRAPDRDDADQGQLRGPPLVLAGRRVRGLRERRQRGLLQRARVQEGVLRALGRDQGTRLPGKARGQSLSVRLHRRHRQPQRRARRRRRGELHRQPRPGGRHARRIAAKARSTAGSRARTRIRARCRGSGRRRTPGRRSGMPWPRARASSPRARASRCASSPGRICPASPRTRERWSSRATRAACRWAARSVEPPSRPPSRSGRRRIPRAPISIASRSSRGGWTRRASPRTRSSTPSGVAIASRTATAKCPRSATPWT